MLLKNGNASFRDPCLTEFHTLQRCQGFEVDHPIVGDFVAGKQAEFLQAGKPLEVLERVVRELMAIVESEILKVGEPCKRA
jgi:hypothetical protein